MGRERENLIKKILVGWMECTRESAAHLRRKEAAARSMAKKKCKMSQGKSLCLDVKQLEHVFEGVKIDVPIYLRDGEKPCVLTTEMKLEFGLCYEDGGVVPKDTYKVTGIFAIPVGAGRPCVVTLWFPDADAHLSKRLEIHAAAVHDNDVRGVSSRKFKVVRCKLGLAYTWDKVFYKDEGGKGKCLEVEATVRDHRGNLVTGRELRLKTVLRRRIDGGVVDCFEVLNGDEKGIVELSEETGWRANLKLRITKASLRHDKSDFYFCISADASVKLENADVAPVRTQDVNVKTKHNNKPKAAPKRSIDVVDDQDAVVPRTTVRNTSLRDSIIRCQDKAAQLGHGAEANFIKDVLKYIERMPWGVTGFDTNGEPLFSLGNPNDHIAAIVQSFEDNMSNAPGVAAQAPPRAVAFHDDRVAYPQPSDEIPTEDSMSDDILGDDVSVTDADLAEWATLGVEDDVHIVLGSVLACGFPAFDCDQRLLGFYRQDLDKRGLASHRDVPLTFTTIASLRLTMNVDAAITAAKNKYNAQLRTDADSVFYRCKFHTIDDLCKSLLSYYHAQNPMAF